MRASWSLFALVVLAGCLGAPAPGEPTDNATRPTPGAMPGGTPPPQDVTPPGPPAPVAYRVLATGQQSELGYPVRLVFSDAEEWASFWREHEKKTYEGATGGPTPASAPPEVDFSRERAVAVTLGDRPDTCWNVRVTNATASGGVTTLTVTTYRPGGDQACLFMITQPYAMVAIPNDGTELAYRDEEKVGRPPESA